jgi:putative phage-type endonuclease
MSSRAQSTGISASRANRMAALVLERLTGQPEETYQSAAMLHGIETEAEARAAYEFLNDAQVTEVGLIRHPRIERSHASPDGLIGDDGVLELKCPQPAAHLEFLLTGKVPEKYVTQMMWQLACSGRQWADFASYSPAFPPEMRLATKRIERDDAKIAELEKAVIEFLAEVDEGRGAAPPLRATRAGARNAGRGAARKAQVVRPARAVPDRARVQGRALPALPRESRRRCSSSATRPTRRRRSSSYAPSSASGTSARLACVREVDGNLRARSRPSATMKARHDPRPS